MATESKLSKFHREITVGSLVTDVAIGTQPYRVLEVMDGGVIGFPVYTNKIANSCNIYLRVIPFSAIPIPKAVPGQLYAKGLGRAVGQQDGSLRLVVCAAGEVVGLTGTGSALEFDPAEWKAV